MQDIEGDDKTLQELLTGAPFGIDYYQREYRWKRKQLQELVEDLYDQFSQGWEPGGKTEVDHLPSYFLGSIVVSKAGDTRNIVDGQQRITSLMLLLIYLNHLQEAVIGSDSEVKKVGTIKTLVRAETPGGYKFVLDIPERNACMLALMEGKAYPSEGQPPSVVNLVERYENLGEIFQEICQPNLEAAELHAFIWWLIGKVKLIEIVTQDRGDAYTVFETMNDRGLSLTPTDMLKGYLLAQIKDPAQRKEADSLIKKYLERFAGHGEGVAADFFKTWLRAQHARDIRERKKNAEPKDFDLIGTEYHRWVQSNKECLSLKRSEHFYRFVTQEMKFFADLYLKLLDAGKSRTAGLEGVKYNADAGFTLQHHVTMAAVALEDKESVAMKKVGLVADFLDCWLTLRSWNWKSNSYSSMQYAVFTVIRDVRGKSLLEIRKVLHKRLLNEHKEILRDSEGRTKAFHDMFSLHQQNGKIVQRILARFTDWMETAAGEPGRYEDYIVKSGKRAYEIEHVLANDHDAFGDGFDDKADFEGLRDYVGGLLLLPKSVNAALGADSYEDKIGEYLKQNKLAQSLHPDFHSKKRPKKLWDAIADHSLPFKPHTSFSKKEIQSRTELYCALAELLWSPERIRPAE